MFDLLRGTEPVLLLYAEDVVDGLEALAGESTSRVPATVDTASDAAISVLARRPD